MPASLVGNGHGLALPRSPATWPRLGAVVKYLSAFLMLSAVVVAGQNSPTPATLVLRNGKIVTVDAAMPEAQAIARGEPRRGFSLP